MSEQRQTELLEKLFSGSEPLASTTRPNDTTAYDIGDVVGESPAANLVFSNVSPFSGSQFVVAGVFLKIDVASIPTGMGAFRLHLFNAAPTAIADNAPFNLIAADRTKYLGWINIDKPEDLGDTLYINMDNVNRKRALAYGSTTLYGVLQTMAAYTPTVQTSKKIGLSILGV